ncbi:MAG: ATP-binding protein [Sphingomicrobium sp.]
MTAEARPSFPVSAVVIAAVAMLLVAGASIAANWVVGERVRLMMRSQFSVLATVKDIETLVAQRDSAMRLAVTTGQKSYLADWHNIDPEFHRSLALLEQAIRLPQNRAAFLAANRAERELQPLDDRIGRMVAGNNRAGARSLFESRRYSQFRGEFNDRIDEIKDRSTRFVAASQRDVDRYLALALVASILAILLMPLILYLLYRPTKAWARQIAHLERKASAASAAKGEFLATMSHEIRTPLNGVIGFTDMLLLDHGIEPRHRRQVELIQNAGAMLLTVVNDVLDYSKIEAGKLELCPETFSIAVMVDNCVSIARVSADIKQLTLTTSLSETLSRHYFGDCDRLRQILLKLLNNAIKFTQQGGITVSVDASPLGEDRHRVTIAVSDSGIGIPEDRIDQLFGSFVQSDASIARLYGGTGLGLTISRRLVELMGGTITVDSALGEGSIFTVTVDLPCCEEPEIVFEDALPQVARLKVLVAEDLPMNQELVVAMLRSLGHDADIACSGEEAVERAGGDVFDIILMDIQMPGIDGVTAARRIRALPAPYGEIPIVAMTANTLPRQIESYLEAGMNGHIAKPLRRRDVAEALACTLPGSGTAAQVTGDDLPIFDSERFESVRQMLPEKRLNEHVEALAQLIAGTAALDPDDAMLEAQVHKIGSQAGTLGWMRISAAARDLEAACRDNSGRSAALVAFQAVAGDVGNRPKEA